MATMIGVITCLLYQGYSTVVQMKDASIIRWNIRSTGTEKSSTRGHRESAAGAIGTTFGSVLGYHRFQRRCLDSPGADSWQSRYRDVAGWSTEPIRWGEFNPKSLPRTACRLMLRRFCVGLLRRVLSQPASVVSRLRFSRSRQVKCCSHGWACSFAYSSG